MISKSVSDTYAIAREFADKLESRTDGRAVVIALRGDLGSGKTTFTKAFAEAFGIPPADIISPTFVIEKRFPIKNHARFKTLIHIDAYRLEKAGEIEKLGWGKTIGDASNLLLIEWPENIGAALPDDSTEIDFTFIDENTREINFN